MDAAADEMDAWVEAGVCWSCFMILTTRADSDGGGCDTN